MHLFLIIYLVSLITSLFWAVLYSVEHDAQLKRLALFAVFPPLILLVALILAGLKWEERRQEREMDKFIAERKARKIDPQ